MKWLVEYTSSDRPTKIEVVAMTEKTVTFVNKYRSDGKEKRINPDLFDTFEQAKAFIIERQETKLKSLRLQLDRENGYLGNLKSMKNPDEKEGAK